MSGHSKWSTIKHRKGAKDAQKGKIFGKHAKLIEIAARAGGDPEKNSSLMLAIENAKAENVPNDNIQRAIKKGSGESKESTIYEEIVYEGYLPGGAAIIIEVLTDNRNRTIANVRTALSKNGGNMGESGSVNWMFSKKGEIEIDLNGKNIEEFEMNIIESGADDFEISDDNQNAFIYTKDKNLGSVRDFLSKAGYKINKAKLSWIANQNVEISDKQKAERVLKITELLENDDDVSDIYSNFIFNDEVMKELGM